MKEEKNIPIEEIEKILDALENGQEFESNLPKEAIEIIKKFHKSIEELPVKEEFINNLLDEVRQKISEKKMEQDYEPVQSSSWFNLRNFAAAFASIVFVVGFYYMYQGMSNLDYGDYNFSSKDNKTITTETNKSPVLNRFAAVDELSGVVINADGYKERSTGKSGRRDKSAEGMIGGLPSEAIMDSVDGEFEESLPSPSFSGEARKEMDADYSDDFMEVTNVEKNSIERQSVSNLKGGEIDDNEKFDEYSDYLKNATRGNGYDIDISKRHLIEVVDNRQVGVLGKKVVAVDNLDNRYELITDTDGRVYFYPSVYLVGENGQQNSNNKCDGKKEFDREQMCEAFFSGYYFDAEIGRCIKESTSGCSSPYYFSDKESCEKECKGQDKIAEDNPNKFEVFVDNQKYDFFAEDKTWKISLENKEDNTDDLVLDLVFTLDTTGSMSDQINKLKVTIESISEKVTDMQVKPKIRYGLVVYKDKTDDYLTRIYDFTDDLDEFRKTLETLKAGGGGDYPEDVNTALADTLEELSWSTDKNVVKISFLIADAPPHMDYGQKYDYRTAMLRALELGVKIFPIASSGLDNTEGEFMFRQIALITNAKYVFITNASGGSDYHVSEQDYSVSALDSLVVKLIKEELDQVR